MKEQRLCSFTGCVRRHYAKGYCSPHYWMKHRTGRVGPLKDKRTTYADVSKGGAAGRVWAMWGAARNYPCIRCGKMGNRKMRWKYDGHDPRELTGPDGAKYSAYPEFYYPVCPKCDGRAVWRLDIDDLIDAPGAHSRVRKLWGPAKLYSCIACGGEAMDWAYDGTDPSQLYGYMRGSGSGGMSVSWIFYSRYPEFYAPMCKKCHKGRDAERARRELFEYRMWKHVTGLTLGTAGAALELTAPLLPVAA